MITTPALMLHQKVFLGTKEDLEKAISFSGEGPGRRRRHYRVATKLLEDRYRSGGFLIRGKFEESAKMYQRVVEMALTHTASHESSWGQARKLLEKLNPDESQKKVVTEAFFTINKPAP